MFSIIVAIHLLFAVIWVGGMFFAYVVLRPAAAQILDVENRLPLWGKTFDRFFPWVWAAVVLLPTSGYGMVYLEFGGLEQVGFHIILMQLIGIPMILMFLHLYFAPYKRLRNALIIQDLSGAAIQLNTIRRLVGINLVLGLILVAVGGAGQYWY